MSSIPIDQSQIYLEYKPKVTAYVRGKISDYDEVEDLVEDIFLKVYKNLDRFNPEKASISTWIYTITSRTVLDYYRGRRVFDAIPDENGAEGLMPDQLIDSNSVETPLLEEEELNQLAAALNKLPVKERDIIILHYYSNIKLKDVAEKMKMSYANAKVLHKKALTHLHEAMEAIL